MNKIHFDQLNFRNNKAEFFILILCATILIFNFFEFINFENKTWNKLINVIPFLILIFFHSKIFWFKNFVQWNKKGIVIKLNNFWSKSFKFEDINKFDIQNQTLEINKYDGTKNIFQLNNIDTTSIEKLQQILIQNLK
ncbi:hypothetical protein [Chryseobacterium oryzae]|uniref:PH domain-containing protein n=1 Tax=Chryseobacterium oryzae TaxID=2929799 RepID=A0ABY4BCY1_9FLAO|nr:hypothetical protein [Chryseobacterium oryzae]UOE37012.1 hypothetical protein MTP08_08000 [Chryseobacterium oryzae]